MNPAAIGELTTRLGESVVSTRSSDRQAASRDESDLGATLPDCVVFAEATEDVIAAVETCRKFKAPLTVRGAGTSLEGNAIPVRGGAVLDLSRMTGVLEVRPGDAQVTVEAGCTWAALTEAVEAHGLFLPPAPLDPAATIGGMVAKASVGPLALKYGGMRRRVLGLTAVTGAGEVIRAGHRAPYGAAGYDLRSLLVGSEGTLAVVTETTLSLAARPAATETWAATFASEAACFNAVRALAAVELAACEYLDGRCLAAGRHPERPALVLEVHGASADAARVLGKAARILVSQAGGQPLDVPDPWTLCRATPSAVRSLHMGTVTLRCDLAVPVGALAELIDLAHSERDRRGVELYAFGHALLGMIQVIIPARTDAATFERAAEVKDRLVEHVVDLGGSCAGENGVGLGNRRYLNREHGLAVEVMKRVKQAMDPDGILNPGKVFP